MNDFALLGVCNNITNNIQKIKVWSQSFKQHCDSEVYLVCINATKEELGLVSRLKIKAIPGEESDCWNLYHKRLRHTLEVLKTLTEKYVLVTDVFDVMFQSNPFLKLDFDNYNVFVGQEGGVLVHEEPWNRTNVSDLFPNEIDKCWSMPVVCSGVIAGKTKCLISLYDELFQLCENSTKSTNIIDQAALHVMIANNRIPGLKQFDLNDGWVVHCAVAGPTQFFEQWGFKTYITTRGLCVPKLENNAVVKDNGELYSMVHQFNRVPEWNAALVSKYE